MKDIQGQRDHRRIGIKKVGVKNISYPIVVLDRAKRRQRTVATVNMYVNLPHHFKGTHMSRFVEILNRCRGEINLANLGQVLVEMKERLQAEAAHLEIEFPYFLRDNQTTRPNDQEAAGIDTAEHLNGQGVPPVAANEAGWRASGRGAARSPQDDAASGDRLREYRCRMHGSLATREELTLAITIPIAPPRPAPGCPGLPRSLGHWGSADITLRFRRFVWIEEIIELVARVTQHDLCWPDGVEGAETDCDLSVENMARALGGELERHPDVRDFTVRVENLAAGFNTFATLSGGNSS